MSSGFLKLFVLSVTEDVSEHGAVHDIGEVPLEDAHGFALGVASAACSFVEVAGGGVAAQLGDGHAVEDGIDLAVPALIEAVTDGLAGAFAR